MQLEFGTHLVGLIENRRSESRRFYFKRRRNNMNPEDDDHLLDFNLTTLNTETLDANHS